MQRKNKIGIFFGVLGILIIGSVFASALIIEFQTISLQEFIDSQILLNEKQKEVISLDLESAGFNLKERYSFYEIVEIAQQMELSDDVYIADWGTISNFLQNEYQSGSSITKVQYHVTPGRNCSHIDPGFFWDSHAYGNCAESCANLNTCYSCCDAAYNSGDYDENELGWCERKCRGAFQPQESEIE